MWKLCEQIKEEKEQSLNEYYAVFISNDKRQVCFFLIQWNSTSIHTILFGHFFITGTLICFSKMPIKFVT